MKSQKGSIEVQLYCFFNLGIRRGRWLTPRPGRFTPRKESRYPLYWRLVGSQGRSGRVQKPRSHRDSTPGLPIVYLLKILWFY